MASIKKRKAKKITEPSDSKAKSKDEILKVRTIVTNVIVDNAVQMAERLVQSVTEGGQVTALKYLWEVSGLFPAGGVEESGEQDSLAKILIERMGLQEEPPAGGQSRPGDVESEELFSSPR
jgi:hypothetical protein